MALFLATKASLRALSLHVASHSRGTQCRLESTRALVAPQRVSTSPVDAANAEGAEPLPIAAFFAAYPAFNYDPKKNPWNECYRLCKFLGIARKKSSNVDTGGVDLDDKKAAREQLKVQLRTAMIRQFNEVYGTDVFSLPSWQKLCRKVGIPVPDTIAECQEAIAATHVNLVDLTMSSKGEVVTRYATEEDLANYTNATKNYYPREHVEAGDILVTLLRHIRDRYSEE